MRRHLASLLPLMLATISLAVGCASALRAEPIAPKGLVLPDPAKGARAGAVVTAKYADSYRAVLPPEVADLVARGELAFEALLNPRQPKRFTRDFNTGSELIELGRDGVLKRLPKAGLPAAAFAPSLTGAGGIDDGYKALWNVASNLWRYPALTVEFSAYLFAKPDSSPRRLDFEVERIHPLSLGVAAGELTPVFRERLVARRPEAIGKLAWLTLRYFGQGEDFVWVSSPVTNRTRQLTGSNRSDPIFSGMFSTDDLFVWSGKVESVEVLGVGNVSLLVPIFEGADGEVKRQEDCVNYNWSGESAIEFSAQRKRFEGVGGWVPNSVSMALRELSRIEMLSRDPFSAEARQILYIDRVSGLPIYRMVWDTAGRLRKVVIAFARGLLNEGGVSEPLLAGQVILSVGQESRLLLLYDSMRVCKGFPPGKSLGDYDPHREEGLGGG
ncbi:MAG: hypothetical protein ACK5Y6_09470, partial [Pseudomonadota bacterium]